MFFPPLSSQSLLVRLPPLHSQSTLSLQKRLRKREASDGISSCCRTRFIFSCGLAMLPSYGKEIQRQSLESDTPPVLRSPTGRLSYTTVTHVPRAQTRDVCSFFLVQSLWALMGPGYLIVYVDCGVHDLFCSFNPSSPSSVGLSKLHLIFGCGLLHLFPSVAE